MDAVVQRRFYTPTQVAQITSMSVRTIQRRIDDGSIGAAKLPKSGYHRISFESLINYLRTLGTEYSSIVERLLSDDH